MATPPSGEPFTIEGIKVLFLLFGGGSAALATWFQDSLSASASAAQNMMLLPILIALTSSILGLVLTSVLAVNRDSYNLISHQFDVSQAQAIGALTEASAQRQEFIEQQELGRESAKNKGMSDKKYDEKIERGLGKLHDFSIQADRSLNESIVRLDRVREHWKWLTRACYTMALIAVISIALGGWNVINEGVASPKSPATIDQNKI